MSQRQRHLMWGVGGLALLAFLLLMGRIMWGRAWETIHPGPDTTRVMGPLHEDGTIDYVGAYNAEGSRGVTMENNAYVLLRDVVEGKDSVPKGLRGVLENKFGFPEKDSLAKNGKFFKPFPAWMRVKVGVTVLGEEADRKAWQTRMNAARKRPWKVAEDKDLAEWIGEMEDPLLLAEEASRRERFFFPAVVADDSFSMNAVRLPSLGSARGVCEGLVVRAMMRIAAGDVAGCDADLLAVQRLGRLMMQSRDATIYTVGASCAGLAAEGEFQAAAAGLGIQDARKWQAERAALGSLPEAWEVMDIGGRFWMLSIMTNYKRFGMDGGTGRDDEGNPAKPAGIFAFGWMPVKFDQVLREVNVWFDRAVAAAKLPTYRERRDAFNALKTERAARKEALGGVSNTNVLLRMTLDMPSFSNGSLCMVRDRLQARVGLARMAMAIAAYKTRTGQLPEELSDLTPEDGIEKIIDPFFNAPFMYHKEKAGYIIYSIGENLIDDHGVKDERPAREIVLDDSDAPLPHDDIAMRAEK